MTVWILYILLLAMALCIGSFLNVVIYRGPIVWRLVDLDAEVNDSQQKLSLAFPASHCPHCKMPIGLFYLIPVIGFLTLQGKCMDCGGKINPRYPVIELLAALAAIISIVVWGMTAQALVAFVFFAFLMTLGTIDLETRFLPDALTLPLIVLGLLVNIDTWPPSGFAPFSASLIGAVAGYLAFWFIRFVYERTRRIDGLGLGDAKMLAALGAWLGWYTLPFLVLISAVLGLVAILIGKFGGAEVTTETPVPFGPFLSIAGAFLLILSGTNILVL